ncbi:oxygen-independent coproporphyrinogen III oxidase [Marinilabiliaceae bacterium ANBcel2]|nr:oxygen-independent coproporphyrinogen III oxidase [Marinilabiliaceae bacterium ANBcel2]
MDIKKLTEKYNKAVPRYTSYPPANYFSNKFTPEDYKVAVKESNLLSPQNVSIYIHIPFCSKLCFYCGCNTLISQSLKLKREYIDALKKEITVISQWIKKDRTVTQIHWGGGTPNSLESDQIIEIMELLKKSFSISNNAEIAIECNPAYLNKPYLLKLLKAGFNRVSLGIQDFNSDILKGVNRDKSELPVEELIKIIQKRGAGVNLDFIYGLPQQTTESFKETIKQAVALEPDRLVTFSYAHVPWVKPHQSVLKKESIPSPNEKLEMFSAAWDVITDSKKYIPIGMDHFAKKDDQLSHAYKNNNLHRNFQGYCTKETTGQVYAFGVSAISQTERAYAQNTKEIRKYIDNISQGIPATEKGLFLSKEEQIVRELITELMCNNKLVWKNAADHLSSTPEELQRITQYSPEKMKEFVDDQLAEADLNEITIKEAGRFVVRNIAAILDPKLNSMDNCFSKSI